MTEPIEINNDLMSTKPRGLWSESWRRLRKDRLAVLSLLCIAGFLFVALGAQITYMRWEWFQKAKTKSTELLQPWNGFSKSDADYETLRERLYADPQGRTLLDELDGLGGQAKTGRYRLDFYRNSVQEKYAAENLKPAFVDATSSLTGASDPVSDFQKLKDVANSRGLSTAFDEASSGMSAGSVSVPELASLQAQLFDAVQQKEFKFPLGMKNPNVNTLVDNRRPPYWLEEDADLEGRTKQRYLLGSDTYGRDVFSRIIMGSTVALKVALVSQGIALILGIFLGAVAGYFGGVTDDLISWVMQVFWSIPFIVMVIVLSVAMPEKILGIEITGEMKVYIAVGIGSWVTIARIVRAQFLSLREKEYVEAARALGSGHARMILFHILPNTLAPVIVVTAMGFSIAIMGEAGLSFIGLGVDRPNPSWGRAIAESWQDFDHWWIFLFPSLVLMFTVFIFNIFGDGLRDALDPRLNQ